MWNVDQSLPGRGEPGSRETEEDAAEWVRRKLGFDPDPVQRRVLATGTKRGLLNCTRQWGKSTVTAAKAVHRACSAKESLTLVVSPSARQSGEFVRKAAAFTRRLQIRPTGGEMTLEFPNGARIVGLPGSEATIRGYSAVSLMLVDEAARVSDELYLALRPMLAVSAGTLWLMSTPFGKRGFFWEAWERGGAEWERIRVTGEECPRIAREFLAEERKAMGERWYRQEYGCEFTEASSGVFARDLVEGAITGAFPPLRIR